MVCLSSAHIMCLRTELSSLRQYTPSPFITNDIFSGLRYLPVQILLQFAASFLAALAGFSLEALSLYKEKHVLKWHYRYQKYRDGPLQTLGKALNPLHD